MGGWGFYPKYLRSLPFFGPLIFGIGHIPDGYFGVIFPPNSGRGHIGATFPRVGARIQPGRKALQT